MSVKQERVKYIEKQEQAVDYIIYAALALAPSSVSVSYHSDCFLNCDDAWTICTKHISI